MADSITEGQSGLGSEVSSFLVGYGVTTSAQSDISPSTSSSNEMSAATDSEDGVFDLAAAITAVEASAKASEPSSDRELTFTDVMKTEQKRITSELGNKLPGLDLI